MRTTIKPLVIIAMAGAAVLSSAAGATTLLYEFTPSPGATTPAFSFTMDSRPTPTTVFPTSFTINPINVTISGVAAPDCLAFYLAPGGGMADICGRDQINLFGAQLFEGTLADPIFDARYLGLNNVLGVPQGFLNVTYVATMDGAVPEPSTWAMMLLGFGVASAALRARRKGLAAVA